MTGTLTMNRRLLALTVCLVALSAPLVSAVTLVRMPESSAFRLVVASTRLRTLAEAAGAVGVLLDVHEAPSAHSDDVEDGHSVQEKSRLANKAAFKP